MRLRSIAATLTIALAAAPLQAQIAPAGTFGSLPANSFGGSGIPTNAVMLGGANGVTLGLSATPRYTSPALTNNGLGTFYALPGQSTGAPVNTGFAAWNFDYFIGGSSASDYFTLFVDTQAGFGTPQGSLLAFNFAGGAGNVFDSSNLKFFSGTFDPNAQGEYTFAIFQYSDAARTLELDHVAINVDVTSTPEPASLVLLATGLLGIGGIARRRRSMSS